MAAANLPMDAVLGKVRRRLIPFLFLLYIVSYLDRINVGFAALQMNAALGLSATAYGTMGIFVKAAFAAVPAAIIVGLLLMLVTALFAALAGDGGFVMMRRSF